jgi:hypothetical protein
VEEVMDEESKGSGKPSSIKPPMIKPPMAAPPPASYQPTMQTPAAQSGRPPVRESANKLIIVINIILALALIVGLLILAYRWFR